MEDMKRVNVDGEEYVIVPICPMTGYPERYTKGRTEEEIADFRESIRDILGRSLYDYAERCGALKRTETLFYENGDTIIECEVQVLVKARIWEEVVRGDPERNPPCTHDT
jgi:hypothetical protein